jgi:hypothetical protein
VLEQNQGDAKENYGGEANYELLAIPNVNLWHLIALRLAKVSRNQRGARKAECAKAAREGLQPPPPER